MISKPIFFIIAILLEIYVLASVGGAIGGFLTVLLVVITALVGLTLLKKQGFSELNMTKIKNIQSPNTEILERVVIIISSILLIIPGFITDTIGILGIIPLTRMYFLKKILSNNFAKKFKYQKQQENKKETIEGQFWED